MDRGQAFTLESITAGLLLIGGLVFALQATAVTPLSASTSSQHIENQQQAVAEGVLAAAVDDDALSVTLRYWNDSGATFHDSSDEAYYVDEDLDTRFGALLQRALTSRSIVANVYVHYETPAGGSRVQRVVYRGAPSDNAVSASARTVLFDDDPLLDADARPTGTTLADADTFYAPDAHPDSIVFNVVRVEVVAWRQ
ncbi:DUF7288 family protein [Halosegnis marinus]|uniref:Uncharacterized protein n=1 Tax=Halosegnis marinus TaxID=3034023 RepID=A0ABD5ZRM2_9EURY|nr:hypothetical protein [Halosegnis sp. DT85]